ncbi:MAG: hypothetical protein HS102_19335 [Planctomycetia bacterium]|nr:hypothetical protein [Planctomycetia bacterium]
MKSRSRPCCPCRPSRFPLFHEARRIVNRDGHVEVDKSYYSVPPEFLGRTVWVRWDSRVVRVFDQDLRQIAMHARHEPGRFATQPAHIAAEKPRGHRTRHGLVAEEGASHRL